MEGLESLKKQMEERRKRKEFLSFLFLVE